MEIGPVTRPGPSNVGSVSRIVPTASAAPVAAELPSTAVQQAPDVPPTQAEPQRSPMADPNAVDRQIKIDPATQQVIYQAVDKTSGEVVRQIPEETMLRLQVYARAMRHAAADKKAPDGTLA